MPNVGPLELVIVLVIALIVLGPKRLPEMGRQIGRALREFRAATSSVRSELGVDEVGEIRSSLSVDGLTGDVDAIRSDLDSAATGVARDTDDIRSGLSLSSEPATAPAADRAEPPAERQ